MAQRGVRKKTKGTARARKRSTRERGGRKRAAAARKSAARKTTRRAAGRQVPLRTESTRAGTEGGGGRDRDDLTTPSDAIFTGGEER